MMQMQRVSSSQIAEMGHDPETNTMQVKFNGGSTYEYDGVDAETFESVINAESVGSAFNSTIKAGGFNYRRV